MACVVTGEDSGAINAGGAMFRVSLNLILGATTWSGVIGTCDDEGDSGGV